MLELSFPAFGGQWEAIAPGLACLVALAKRDDYIAPSSQPFVCSQAQWLVHGELAATRSLEAENHTKEVTLSEINSFTSRRRRALLHFKV